MSIVGEQRNECLGKHVMENCIGKAAANITQHCNQNVREKRHDIDVDDDGRRQQQQPNATTTPAINVFGICALSVRLQPNTCHFIKAKIKTLYEYYFNAYLNWNINSFCIASAYVHKYTRASIQCQQQQQLKWNMLLFCRPWQPFEADAS